MKYIVEYEVEAPDLNSASVWAHELLFKADEDVISVKVRAVEPAKTGRTFADGGLTGQRIGSGYAGVGGYTPTVMPSIPMELSPRVYDHIVGGFVGGVSINGEDG